MFKYDLACSDIDRVLTYIDRSISMDSTPYSAGIHFKERKGMNIKGFTLSGNEWDSIRGGSPIGVKFSGKFLLKEECMVLRLYTYPIEWQCILVLIGLLSAIWIGNLMGICVWTCVLLFCLKMYRDLTQETVDRLTKIVKNDFFV